MNLKEIVIPIIDWGWYLILCLFAGYFIIKSDVIQKYLNKNTDTYGTEIELKELPDFTFCDWSGKILDFEYDVDYNLELIVRNYKSGTEVVNFTKYSRFKGKCMVISPKHQLNFTDINNHSMRLRFNTSIPLKRMPQLTTYVISKNNPRLFGRHFDGKPMQETINPQEEAFFGISEERTEYLPENCRAQSILEYLANNFIENDVNCSAKCFPRDYQFGKVFDEKMIGYPFCENSKTTRCIVDWLRNISRKAKVYCKKTSYTGATNVRQFKENENWCSQVCSKIYIIILK